MSNKPIAVFDSGIGGLTVLQALRHHFPQESFVYLGDTARLPYGTKSPDTVAQYAAQMTDVLMQDNPKAIVIACNTASALGLEAVVRQAKNIPVIGMIEPTVKHAVAATRNRHIAILGTQGTVRSGAYANAIHKVNPDIQVTSLACQLLVALAEEGWQDHPISRDALETYLAPILTTGNIPDTLILGCTHFPVFIQPLQKLLPNTQFIHCGDAAADALRPLIAKEKSVADLIPPFLKLLVTDGAENFIRTAQQFLKEPHAKHHLQVIDALDRAA